MTLDCGHVCNLLCHKSRSHDGIFCTMPCTRTCPEGHPCLKKCFEECGKCRVKLVKKLPCGHDEVTIDIKTIFQTLNKMCVVFQQVKMECWKPPQEVYCPVRVEKVLNDCQHDAKLACSRSTEGFKCQLPCGRQICAHGHPCLKVCWETCSLCNVPMDRELTCGHRLTLPCHVDPFGIECKVPKRAVLPGCGHKVKIRCGEKPNEALCTFPCDVRLDCGHRCTRRYHFYILKLVLVQI